MLDAERIAQVIIDAAALGDDVAGAKHGLSTRTLRRYRERLVTEPDGEVASLVQVKRKALSERWLVATAEARDRLLAKVLTLAENADTEQLRDVVGALKIVHDANVSERVIADGLGGEGAGDACADQEAPPFAAGANAIARKLDA